MATDDWAPTLDDVGALLRSRTRDTSGNEVGTFTAATKPTDRQVASIIEQSVQDLADMTKAEDMPRRFWGSAKRVATLDAAMHVELSFFPDQINTGRSPYPQLKEERDERLKQLRADLESEGTDTSGDTGTPDPVGFFPSYPIVGWDAGPW